jgi:hypothetical protein
MNLGRAAGASERGWSCVLISDIGDERVSLERWTAWKKSVACYQQIPGIDHQITIQT